jgi:large subunit ribosomal protein L28
VALHRSITTTRNDAYIYNPQPAHTYTRITMSTSIPRILSRGTNPAILPIPSRTTGNNVPKSLHKTRRTWQPNVGRFDLPISALASGSTLRSPIMTTTTGRMVAKSPEIRGVKMQSRRIKDVEKAGGIEGVLVSSTLRGYSVRALS